MTEETARRLGRYIQPLRGRKKWGVRELALRAGLDVSVIVQLESGRARHPRLDTLTAPANAVGTPLVEVLARAGQIEACGVPCIEMHLRLCYSQLSEVAIREIETYVERVVKKVEAMGVDGEVRNGV
jgi:transcriptional regulator with XRE-family HTH domain